MAEAGNCSRLEPYGYSTDEESEEEIQCLADFLGEEFLNRGDNKSKKEEVHQKIINSSREAHLKLGLKPLSEDTLRSDENAFVTTDDDLLNWEPTYWRVFDNPNRLEVYKIIVENDTCVESECREMLGQIGCEKRFICCSIEVPYVFYAWLKQEEAEKLKGVDGITGLIMRRMIFVDD